MKKIMHGIDMGYSICLNSLGGTILMERGPDGYLVPSERAKENLIANLPPDVEFIDQCNLDSIDLEPKDILLGGNTLVDCLNKKSYLGAMQAQGTDRTTMIGTILDLIKYLRKPLGQTGAWYSYDNKRYDGLRNVDDAYITTKHGNFSSVLIVFHGKVRFPEYLRKRLYHDPFESELRKPIAEIVGRGKWPVRRILYLPPKKWYIALKGGERGKVIRYELSEREVARLRRLMKKNDRQSKATWQTYLYNWKKDAAINSQSKEKREEFEEYACEFFNVRKKVLRNDILENRSFDKTFFDDRFDFRRVHIVDGRNPKEMYEKCIEDGEIDGMIIPALGEGHVSKKWGDLLFKAEEHGVLIGIKPIPRGTPTFEYGVTKRNIDHHVYPIGRRDEGEGQVKAAWILGHKKIVEKIATSYGLDPLRVEGSMLSAGIYLRHKDRTKLDRILGTQTYLDFALCKNLTFTEALFLNIKIMSGI